jgi:hypothetical protein
LGLIAGMCGVLGSTTASATPIYITMTGTLSSGGAGFPWGYASNTVPADAFYSVDGDSFTAHFTFDTTVGTITANPGPAYTLSGPATIASGYIVVAGHTFEVPSCVDSPCTTTTTALYSRSADFIEVLFYEDASASAGIVLQASAETSWGAYLTDPIEDAVVTSPGIDIVLQPPDSYYTLTAFATVNTVSVATPEPSTWAMMLAGFAGLGIVGYRASRKAVSIAA